MYSPHSRMCLVNILLNCIVFFALPLLLLLKLLILTNNFSPFEFLIEVFFNCNSFFTIGHRGFASFTLQFLGNTFFFEFS